MEVYPTVTKETHNKISDYLNNSIYQFKDSKGKYEIGFFCSLKCHDKMNLFLITNYQIINQNYLANNNYIDIATNKGSQRFEIETMYYMNKELDLSVIKIKEDKKEKIKILEIDDDIYKEQSEMYFNKELIYIINNDSVSYGILDDITKSELIINCNLNKNYCYPIFNLATNKLIGIYQKNCKYYHKGIFFKYIINELESKYTKNDNNYNEIEISIKIDDEDINNPIYFLDNKYYEDFKLKSSHDNLKELNKFNTELNIRKDNIIKNEEYKKYFIPKEKGIYNINIKFNINKYNK